MPKKRTKRLTKRERKALHGKGPSGVPTDRHIHCMACGRHIDAHELDAKPPTAEWIRCRHGSTFASCSGCFPESRRRLEEHDRSGQPPQIAAAWH